jgi:galactokinase
VNGDGGMGVEGGQAWDRIEAAFVQAFEAPPDGVWRAPGRVNLIGEHTDYQEGLCLPMAIDRHVVVAARVRPDRRVRAVSAHRGAAPEVLIDALRPGPRGEWFNYVAGVLASLAPPAGCDLYVDADLPAGAGLSSSAALEMAVATAVNDLFALGRTGRELALAGQRAEHAFAGVNTGLMDQLASVFGRPGHALLLDTRTADVTPVPWQPEAAGLALAVVDTRAEHRVVAGGYEARVREVRAAAAALGVPALRDAVPEDLGRLAAEPLLLRRARHVVTENARVRAVVEAAGRGAWERVGALFLESHRSLADDYEVSHPALDAVVQVACRTPGALGARLTGAGFGGSAIVLLRAAAMPALERGLQEEYAARGWPPCQVQTFQPGPGAGRVVPA